LSNTTKAPDVRSARNRNGSGDLGQANKALTYSQISAPPALECAWCEHVFDSGDQYLHGRVKCSQCGVATTSPWPSDAQLAEAYGDWYRPKSGRFSGLGDKVLHRLRATLANRLHRTLPPGPILDVGAGDGNLVEAFVRHGRDAVGLEPYGSGPHIRQAEVEDLDGSWSAVIFWHSLEHVRHPTRALSHAATLVAPGGKMIVAVPNAASLQARAFGDRWFALDLPRHLTHISPAALVSKIQEAGLQVEHVSYYRGGQVVFGWVHGLVGLLPGHPDLYDVIRRNEAQSVKQSLPVRLYALAAGVAVLPVAVVASVIEVATHAGGTVCVQARRDKVPQQPA
jgi:2-polyprenyl-3-methyl-5-hydroxy-6-metoxy-1,4-benzoquinol methylase